MVFWVFSIALSIALLVIAAAMKHTMPDMAYVHMAIAALMCIIFALVGIRETRNLAGSSTSRSAISASTAQYSAYVWVWGALGLLITYGFGVADWHEWWHFFLAFAIVGIATLFFGKLLQRDADAGRDDDSILKIGRYLAYIQFFGMIAVVLGLIIDGKMTRFLTPRYGDWAANNIFFFGALALAAISAYALKIDRSGEPSAEGNA